MRAKKSKRRKNPVLTSPWKIGLFVALMLLVTGFGVGYYLARIYGIDPTWLRSDTSRWIIDSYEFFKEMYPLAAGVVVVALCSYFVIASAVRRYRHYLDSGQDYRRMISLAGSIDDLTNPAQIARLSRFPELQNVLRNYGDQIREISAQIDGRELENRSGGLELAIDAVLAGNPAAETEAEDAWWAPIVRRVEAAMREKAQAASETAGHRDETRQAASRAALACGRAMEAAAAASEDIIEIITTAGRLGESVRDSGRSTGGALPAGSDMLPAGKLETIMLAVRGLEEGGSTMYRFSEESNGHALAIALMAARGNVNEHDLAQCAEKVRMTAEQFGKFGRRLEELSKSLTDEFRAIACSPGDAGAFDPAPASAADMAAELVSRIERRSNMLQDKLVALGNDVEEIGSALRSAGAEPVRTVKAQPAPVDDAGMPEARPETDAHETDTVSGGTPGWTGPPEAATPSRRPDPARDEGMIVNFGAGSGDDKTAAEDRLVVERANAMEVPAAEGDSFWNNQPALDDRATEQDPPRAAQEPPPAARPTAEAAVMDAAVEDSGEKRAIGGEHRPEHGGGAGNAVFEASAKPDAGARAEATAENARQTQGGDWMGMPGHRWVDAAAGDSDMEPIYDLFELGAVECAEETEKIV